MPPVSMSQASVAQCSRRMREQIRQLRDNTFAHEAVVLRARRIELSNLLHCDIERIANHPVNRIHGLLLGTWLLSCPRPLE